MYIVQQKISFDNVYQNLVVIYFVCNIITSVIYEILNQVLKLSEFSGCHWQKSFQKIVNFCISFVFVQFDIMIQLCDIIIYDISYINKRTDF